MGLAGSARRAALALLHAHAGDEPIPNVYGELSKSCSLRPRGWTLGLLVVQRMQGVPRPAGMALFASFPVRIASRAPRACGDGPRWGRCPPPESGGPRGDGPTVSVARQFGHAVDLALAGMGLQDRRKSGVRFRAPPGSRDEPACRGEPGGPDRLPCARGMICGVGREGIKQPSSRQDVKIRVLLTLVEDHRVGAMDRSPQP